MTFSQSIHLLICFYLETLTSIIRIGLPILVELIDLVNSYNFSVSNDLTQMVNLLHYSQTVILTVLLFWIYFFLLMLHLFCNGFPFIGKFWSCYCLSFHYIYNRMPHFISLLMTIPVLIGMVFVITWEMFYGKVSLSSVILLLLVNYVSRFIRLEFISHQKYQVKPH